MSITMLLKKEIEAKPAGVFCPDYFKARALNDNSSLSAAEKRGEACFSLFAFSPAFIYKNDLIVGSRRPMFVDLPDKELKECTEICAETGERCFLTNNDHFAPDYAYILNRGIPGVIEDIDNSIAAYSSQNGEKRIVNLLSMKKAMQGLLRMIGKHIDLAEQLKGAEGYNKSNLDFIIGNLTTLLHGVPDGFASALQLVWLCHTCFGYEGRYAMALGRIDQYLWDFFNKSVSSGEITENEAITLLENVFIKIYEKRAFGDGDDVVNICIGGSNENGESCVNQLSYSVLKAVKNCNVPGPNLSARISDSTPDEFLDECLVSIGTGLGYPALMNDGANIPALSRYGYDKKDVYNYCMVGCIENFIPGKQPPWSDGRFDTPRFFEYLFNNGKGILNGKTSGIDTGNVGEISSMPDFLKRFERQIADGVKKYVDNFNRVNTPENPEDLTSPFLSCFAKECIQSGLDINCGGAKYSSVHGAALMGVGTVCDALAAIEKTVYIDRSLTLDEIREALLCNFEGKENLRQTLLNAPKYGNNDDLVDKYSKWFVEFHFKEFSKYKTRDGGPFYILMAANTSNISAGKLIAATPDGREAGEPLSDAASPTYGRDKSGVTATLQSVAKPDYTLVAGGTVVNQKFLPTMFSGENRKKLLALIKVYFKLGGQEIQINSTSPEILKDAMNHPENYKNLVVRVSGFSAFYVTLDRDVQLDILSRTQQAV
ncbi:MAG: hypothetical protein K6B52_05840 [Clostridiales bacterium]|nr:hypothetical protein [Clostridiales bacterium]